MTVALCPGSYDPPTNGHIDVIQRTARHFQNVIAAVIANPGKRSEFSTEERCDMLAKALGHVGNVQIATFDGLLVDFARARDVSIVIKGLRAVSDFEYELQMAQMNATLAPDLDTMFVCTQPQWAFLSSSLVKEVARFGGDVSGLVPENVAALLNDRFAKR
jgi:pantetheine-phosphate adenylyltransferase